MADRPPYFGGDRAGLEKAKKAAGFTGKRETDIHLSARGPTDPRTGILGSIRGGIDMLKQKGLIGSRSSGRKR